MLRNKTLTALALLAILALLPSMAAAQNTNDYRVQITNLTYGQIFAPPVVAIHTIGARIFQAGQPASTSLAILAEDGDGSGLMADLMADSRVSAVMSGSAVIMPGETVVLEFSSVGDHARLSVAGMLVSTNDAFFGLDGAPISSGPWLQEFMLPAWDAGSETNSESCDTIPGPPCGNPGVRDTGGAEGYVHIHRGISGTGDLTPADHDWRGAVAKISVVRQPS